MRTYHEKNADTGLIKSKKIAIIGYGSQGRAHALNLRDSGAKELRIGLRDTKKSADGFTVTSIAEAAKWADVVVMLTPDETQTGIYTADIVPHAKQGASLVFAHGFNVHFGYINPRPDMDVWMVAPKDVGPMVREQYEKGTGVPGLISVHQDATGHALKLALSYGAAIGCGKKGMMETSFREECEVDLFGEQAVLFGGIPPLMRAAFDTLVAAGYEPEMAYFKCVQQAKLVADAIARLGISGMNEIISNTAEYGGQVAAPKLVTADTKKEMHRLLENIRSGKFAKDWMAENKNGLPRFREAHEKDAAHPLEETGRKLRGELKMSKHIKAGS